MPMSFDRTPARWRLRLVGLVAASVAVPWMARASLGIELDPAALRAMFDDMGGWGPAAFIGLVTVRMLVGMPSWLVLIAGGICFGPAAGSVYGAAGLTLNAFAVFLIARRAGRAAVETRTPVRLRPLLQVAGSPAGAAFVAAGTAYPIGPMTAYHAFAGVTAMSPLVFTLAVLAGAPVRAASFAYFGHSLLSGETTHVVAGVGLLALVAGGPLLLPGPRRWLRSVLREPLA